MSALFGFSGKKDRFVVGPLAMTENQIIEF